MTASSYCKANITRLLHIFKQEAKLLRLGNLNEVMALTPTKMTAMAEMEASFKAITASPSNSQLKPYLSALEKAGAENGRLLQSAIAGARAAKTRLDQLQFQHAQVGTYDPSGKKHSIAQDHIISKKIV
jgi:flagellar biosynthesis/type III secretory pathway chaperone